MSLNIKSPSGEESSFIDAKIFLERSFKFILTDTSVNLTIMFLIPLQEMSLFM